MHEVLVNRLGGLSLPRKSVVRLTDRPDMTLDVYRGRKTTIQPTRSHSTNHGEYFWAYFTYARLSEKTNKLFPVFHRTADHISANSSSFDTI